MASGGGQPLSLRPFPVPDADKKPKNISDFIGRINAQPGGFRSVTEEQLKQEIEEEEQRKQNGEDGDENMDMSDTEGGDPEQAAKDPAAVRMEVLRNIDIAGNAAMLTLDSISLLLSKQNPTAASTTLSQQLRELVGIGTLGADRLDASNATEETTEDKQSIATGWTLMEINQTRDAAQDASKFLQKEIDAEGKYWEGLMQVHSNGWPICRMPNERHTLGVRFGFSEAAPDFRNHGLAPMRRSDDGTIKIDSARIGGASERIAVSYSKHGRIVGRSSLPGPTPDSAPLEERVLDARNTLFAKELWHELTREAKTLAAYDVRPVGTSKLTYAIDDETSIDLELVPLDQDNLANQEVALPHNVLADTISTAIHILLTYAHRSNELMRVRPLPPQLSRSRGSQPYALLRPVIARLQSVHNIQAFTRYTGLLTQSLRKAGLPATFTLHTPQPEVGTPPSGPNQPAASQLLVRALLQPSEFTLKTTLLPDITFTIRGRTFVVPVTATTYTIMLPDSSPLHKTCPPYKDGYPDVRALADYLRTATTRLLTEYALKVLPFASWSRTIKGTSLCHTSQDGSGDAELHFSVEDSDGATPPLLVLEKTESGKADRGRWEWRAEGESEPKSLEDLLRELGEEAIS